MEIYSNIEGLQISNSFKEKIFDYLPPLGKKVNFNNIVIDYDEKKLIQNIIIEIETDDKKYNVINDISTSDCLDFFKYQKRKKRKKYQKFIENIIYSALFNLKLNDFST
jgi:hypothetical protein